jgi:hypothetical protein
MEIDGNWHIDNGFKTIGLNKLPSWNTENLIMMPENTKNISQG